MPIQQTNTFQILTSKSKLVYVIVNM